MSIRKELEEIIEDLKPSDTRVRAFKKFRELIDSLPEEKPECNFKYGELVAVSDKNNQPHAIGLYIEVDGQRFRVGCPSLPSASSSWDNCKRVIIWENEKPELKEGDIGWNILLEDYTTQCCKSDYESAKEGYWGGKKIIGWQAVKG